MYQLVLRSLLERPARFFPSHEIVSRNGDGSIDRCTYAQWYERVRRLAAALPGLGVGRGDRVATLAWNHRRHLELYFAVPCAGSVLHTVNMRLPADHLVHVLNHAEDKVIFADEDLLPLVDAIRPRLKTVRHVVPLGEAYEQLLQAAPTGGAPFAEDLREDEPAAMCYTSATTGDPKGVVYTHRTLYLHSMMSCMADAIALSGSDVVMPVVPMFHVNAWGLPFAATWMGSKQVLPGPRADPKVLAGLIAEERVSLTAGVPTVWLGLQQLAEREPVDLSSLRYVICGGSAPPASQIAFFEERGIPFLHGYGMTEAAPLTHLSHATSGSPEERVAVTRKQGLLVPGLDQRVVDDQGNDVPTDGKQMGEVWLRGPWLADEYYKDPRSADTFRDGWYHSGDLATLDPQGNLEIVDRVKDIVKSGGEWISSVALENALMGHPAVAEAAVIGIPDPRWQERPLACVVPKPGQESSATTESLRSYLEERFPRWWVPEAYELLVELPKTGTGKFDKKVLRERFGNRGNR